jgi:phytoene desaturase
MGAASEFRSPDRGYRRRVRTVPGPTDSVVVVGAGLGGLSAALHLAGAGRLVTVLEQSDAPGGRAGIQQVAGYTFDTGPTVLTAPDLVESTLVAVGESLDGWLRLHRLDPVYRARFADGSVLDVRADPAAMVEEISRACSGDDAAGYRRLVAYLRELYAVEMPHFIDRNLDSPRQLVGAPLLRLVRMGALRRLAPKIATFVRDERLRRIFSFQAMYAGVAPAQALAIYAVISYLDCVAGVYFPEGGMHAIPRALAGAGDKHGVVIRYGARVSRIEVANGRARAVHTASGERIPADVVLVNGDPAVAYRTLLTANESPPRVRHLRYSPSCVVLHAGSSAAYAHTAHHTIEFGAAWERTFREIIADGQLMSDPSFLVTTPTKSDPGLAPPGKNVYYALFPAPNLAHRRPIDWDIEAPRYRDRILGTIEARGYRSFGDAIEVERLVTPADWAEAGLAAGTPFAAAHTVSQTGPFRPPTLHRTIENLLFCGGNTQPGVGVPMALISGRLAAERVIGERRTRASL